MALVVLKIFDTPGEAQLARATLEAYGIPAFVFQQHNPYPGFGLFAERLMVAEDDREAAAVLIEPDPAR